MTEGPGERAAVPARRPSGHVAMYTLAEKKGSPYGAGETMSRPGPCLRGRPRTAGWRLVWVRGRRRSRSGKRWRTSSASSAARMPGRTTPVEPDRRRCPLPPTRWSARTWSRRPLPAGGYGRGDTVDASARPERIPAQSALHVLCPAAVGAPSSGPTATGRPDLQRGGLMKLCEHAVPVADRSAGTWQVLRAAEATGPMGVVPTAGRGLGRFASRVILKIISPGAASLMDLCPRAAPVDGPPTLWSFPCAPPTAS